MNIVILYSQKPSRSNGLQYKLYKQFLGLGYNIEFLSCFGKTYGTSSLGLSNRLFQYELKTVSSIFKHIFRTQNYLISDLWNPNLISQKKVLKELTVKPDLIIATWTKLGFSLRLIERLQEETGAFILFWPPDVALFTGGCHYPCECDRYKDSCGSCPRLGSRRTYDMTRRVMDRKRRIIQNLRCGVVGTSEQLRQASASGLFENKPMRPFVAGGDLDSYNKCRRPKARANLGLKDTNYVIFFGSADLDSERKGMKYLYKALEIFEGAIPEGERDNIILLSAGKNPPDLGIKLKQKNIGYVSDPEFLMDLYACSDVFACPSLYDSGPFMINEALMSGTPVVSFGQGVSGDIIVHGRNGYCAKFKDAEDFAKGLIYFYRMGAEERVRTDAFIGEHARKNLEYARQCDLLMDITRDFMTMDNDR